MKSSPTLVTLQLPKGDFFAMLPSILPLDHHITVTAGKELLLTLANGTTLTSLTAVLVTLSTLFPSDASLPSGFDLAQITPFLTAKPTLATLEDRVATRNFFLNTLSPTLIDFYYFAALSKDLATASVNVTRWTTSVNALLFALSTGKSGVAPTLAPGTATPFVPIDASAAAPTATTAAAPAKDEKKKEEKKGGEPGAPVMSEEEKAAARAKRDAAKAAKPKKAPAAAAPAAELGIDALDFRVGKLIKVWEHEGSEKLYCEEIDMGPELGVRKVASGLRPFYATSDMLEGRLCVVVANLKSRPLAGFPSHGMVLCVSSADHSSVELLDPPAGSELGERVLCAGYEKDAEAENKVAKKKIFEAMAPDMKSNEQGVACWKGIEFRTKAGLCKAEKGMVGGSVA